MKRSVRGSVLKRVAANRQKAADVQRREEQEREMLRLLNQRQKEQKKA